MKEVFVIDGNLDINADQVSEAEWKKGVFTTKIGSQSIIVLRGGWNKFTTYDGSEPKEEAEASKQP